MKNRCINCNEVPKKGRFTRGFCQNCYVWLRNHGLIENLPIPELPIKFTQEQEDILIGSMLGDGNITLPKNGINATFTIKRKIEDKPYLVWEYGKFKEFCTTDGYQGLKEENRFDERTKKYYPSIYFYTRSSPLFTAAHKIWYPNGKKIVPKNLKLTTLSLLIWFLDDGWINIAKSGKIQMGFATNGFTKQEVEFLANYLCKRYNEYFGVHSNGNKEACKKGYGYIIQANGTAALAFIREVDPVFPGFMLRKAKWRTFDGEIKTKASRKLDPALSMINLYSSILDYKNDDKITTGMIVDHILNEIRAENKSRAQDRVLYFLKKFAKQGYLIKTDAGWKKEKFFTITPAGKQFFASELAKLSKAA